MRHSISCSSTRRTTSTRPTWRGSWTALARPGLLADAATVVIETRRDVPPVLPEAWTVGWSRVYGDTLLTVATV